MSGREAGESCEETLRASCVAFGRAGVLILGKSGAGKSCLALRLIGLGGRLVSDDLTRVSAGEGVLIAHAPARLAGVIEARGVGLINTPHVPMAVVGLAVDMDREETERLPESRSMTIAGCGIDLLFRVDAPYFPEAIVQLLTQGRYA